jgi:hypothetical protein
VIVCVWKLTLTARHINPAAPGETDGGGWPSPRGTGRLFLAKAKIGGCFRYEQAASPHLLS